MHSLGLQMKKKSNNDSIQDMDLRLAAGRATVVSKFYQGPLSIPNYRVFVDKG